jgi:hypothetical protein
VKTTHDLNQKDVPFSCLNLLSKRGSCGEEEERKRDYYISSKRRIRSIYKASQAFAPVHRAIISRHHKAPLQMKRALHLAA